MERWVTAQVPRKIAAVLQAAARGAKSRDELAAVAGVKHREHFRKAYLEPLLASRWLERTIPGKPRSPKQRCRTTPAGLEALTNQEQES